MTSLIEEIKKHNLISVWDKEGFAFKKGKEIIHVPWTSVIQVYIRSRIRHYAGFGLASLLDFVRRLPLGLPFVESSTVIKYIDSSGSERIFEDNLNASTSMWDSDSGVGYGLLKMAVEQAPRDTISEDVTEFVRSKTTSTIESLKKKAMARLLFTVGLIILIAAIIRSRR